MSGLEDFLIPTQEELFHQLIEEYKQTAEVVWKKARYILVPGEAPVMLIAHLDTVHKEQVKDICKSKDKTVWMSPQGIGGDDRCGVYALSEVYKNAAQKPWLLFTCDEETGGVGANAFCTDYASGCLPEELDMLKLLVEVDRQGKNDAVYYECDNPELELYISSKGFQTNIGSFSDISLIAPALGIAAVNLSAGYYNAHTKHEYIHVGHLRTTIQKLKEIVNDATEADFPRYEYVEYGDEDDAEWRSSPTEFQGQYAALLDFYSESELDEVRKYGDWAIKTLYENEFWYLEKQNDAGYGGLQ